jgi:Ca2+-dependent lipid-binding protein
MSSNVLSVLVERGENFPKMDTFSETDPFVTLQLEGSKDLFRSKTKTNAGESPEWRESFQFSHVASEGVLTVAAYDEDTVTSHDLIGKVQIDLKPFANTPGEPKEGWYELKGSLAGRNKAQPIRVKLTITLICTGHCLLMENRANIC